jgi:hypothetical protein
VQKFKNPAVARWFDHHRFKTKLLPEAHQREPVSVLVYYTRPAFNVKGVAEVQSLGRHSGKKDV